MRLYTAGIADFEKIRQNNRIYVDKTDLVFRMTHESDFVFLSRPRRFGKSLLCSTRVWPSPSWRRTGKSTPFCIST